jgi:hypothetical protein
LPARFQECRSIFDACIDDLAQCLAIGKLATVPGEDVAHFSLRNGHQIHFVHPILERKKVVKTTA